MPHLYPASGGLAFSSVGATFKGVSCLFFRTQAPGLVFSNDLSTGEFCPLRIPPFGMAAVSPMDKS
jgi:hypothetical protein